MKNHLNITRFLLVFLLLSISILPFDLSYSSNPVLANTTSHYRVVTDTPNLIGEWKINANNSVGKFTIIEQTGQLFSGTVNIDSGRTEQLVDGKIIGNTISFTRMWTSDLKQDYSGTLTIDSQNNATIVGTFTQGRKDSISQFPGPYKWTASSVLTPLVPIIPSTPTIIENNAEAFVYGARIMWQPAQGLGYRLFRSKIQSEIGISVTDFFITGTSYADVNTDPNTTYYYTVKPVLAEANPLQSIDEKLGDTIATFTVTTGNEILNPGVHKNFIMLKLDNPNMSVNGVSQEVDPGRGTTPMIISSRTMVPIKAIIESMGGVLEWDNATQMITIKARGVSLQMWVGKKDIKINGVSKTIDVAPVVKNSRTFVPVRFAAENLNCKIDWITSTKEAVIIYEE